MSVLQIDNLHLALRAARGRAERLILRGIDLDIGAGEVHALVGESGAGKSMVGRTVLGITPPEMRVVAGSIRFLGLDWLGMRPSARREYLGRDIALIPQDPLTALNPGHTIGAQLGDVLRLHLKLDARQATARAVDLLDSVQVRSPATVVRQYPHELSGGMRQRVLIAMAFACKPKLIIADEPTTALDVTVQRQVLRLLRDLQRDEGAAVLFITHNLGLVAKLCDTVSVIHSGRIVEHGTVRAIIESPRTDYTRALFAATPRYDRPAEALRPIDPGVTDALWARARSYDLAFHARMKADPHG
ncbi:ABC transporter ATP-binding protein [Variovorax sp. dw_308]|uniref:ABC transporter ATP-binding protein n=1 Tax=Variovorax sp. dw_308 TaxID=2721546 RepID=UPI001C472BD9|nr:ABC transporter ATP-binding protein [Variovorax sp. dw_308]